MENGRFCPGSPPCGKKLSNGYMEKVCVAELPNIAGAYVSLLGLSLVRLVSLAFNHKALVIYHHWMPGLLATFCASNGGSSRQILRCDFAVSI